MNSNMHMNMNSIPCQFYNHQNHNILTVCLNKTCQSKRLCCLTCLGEFHSAHLEDLIEIDTLNNFINQSCNKQVEYPQSYTFGKCQLIETLKELSNLIDGFQKIIQQEIEGLKQQNLQEYLKQQSNIQQGVEYWNKLIENMLQFAEVKQKLVKSKNLHQEQLNAVELRQLQIINQAKDGLTQIQKSFSKSFKEKQLKLSEEPIKLQGHQGNVFGVAVQSGGDLIASGSDDNTVKLWSLKTKQLLQTFQYTGAVYGVAFSPNYQYLAYGGSGDYSIQLYDLKQNIIFRTFVGHNMNILSIVFSSDSQYLFSGGFDNRLMIWSLNQATNVHSFETDSNIWTIVSPNNEEIISCICDESINIWDFSTKLQLIHLRNPHSTGYGLSSSRDSSMFVSSGSDGFIKIWSFNQNNNNQKVLTLNKQIKAANNTIYNVILASDEQNIVSICNQEKKIMIHQIESGNLIQELHFDNGEYLNGYISFSNDMNVLVSAGEDQMVKIWMRE